ncbi:RNA polymerase I-specific transcription initiation factor RRN3 [Pseudomassariella vexata]|uniref:RNA polymerase I-specific transcription initiation factor RRN3 n=1 Tax=Pseudomassariella vexata TaxID=1141098 RepID=A0A1Y2E371_9PEZI|nr:RNA polymerase I-specific transcription initiation factor RRN3 [Pseudomassariella vexata]ORY65972.1 RNA polymerase I-specific transcription initiation factor RRN3 [Pseudomassariella vexata]
MPVQMPPTSSTADPLKRPATKGVIPLKPILKSSSALLGKRKHSDDVIPSSDGTMDGSQSPQRKRQKVEFDMNLEIHEVGTRSVEEVKQEIRKALDAHARGDDEEYDILKETVSGKHRYNDDDDDEDADPSLPEKRRQELKVCMVALASFVPQLGRSAHGLVKSVLQCQWLGRDEQFAKIYTQFLAALVSAQGSYLTQVVAMVIDKFVDSQSSAWVVAGYPQVSREAMQERLHRGLQYLLQVFPAAKSVISQLMTSKFPYHDEPKRMYLAYVDNLLKLRQYTPQLKTEITDLIVNRLVQIDVQMQMDLDDLDDRLAFLVAAALKESQAAAENQDEDDGDDSDAESVFSDEEDDDANEASRVRKVTESIEKMDSIMDTLFQLYTPHFVNPESDEATKTFEDMLAEFSHIILPTYKSRHTQFLIFHFGQQSERLIDAFCGTCINIAFESQRPLVLRQAATAYLASFVARGAMVPGHIVRTIFEVLGYHLDQMRTLYETTCRGPDVRRYAPFYALMQALMYVFCFRWRDLIRSVPEDVDQDDPSSYLGQDIEWESDIKDILRRNIDSKLNPLKVCSPAIVDQFATLAHRFQFMYLYPKIEANKRIRLSQFVSSAYANGGALRESGLDLSDEGSQQLDSFFPFDPYQLPMSKRWIDDDYLQWKSISRDDEVDDSDDGEPDGADDDIEEDTATDDEAGDE